MNIFTIIPITKLKNLPMKKIPSAWPSLIMLILLLTVGLICWICK